MNKNHFFAIVAVLVALGLSAWVAPKIKDNLDKVAEQAQIPPMPVEFPDDDEEPAEFSGREESEQPKETVSETAETKVSDSKKMSDQKNAGEVAPDEEVAVISTDQGDMVVAFWPDVAPKTVENFKKLANEKFYDGTAFHRIIRGFMIQGGDPNTKVGAGGMPGTGGPGYQIKAEFNDRPHVRGVLSMARSQHPDSAGSQFFIVHGDARFLDNQYTAFGKLIEGDDVLEKIATAPTKPDGRENSTPAQRMGVKTVRIVPFKEVSKKSE